MRCGQRWKSRHGPVLHAGVNIGGIDENRDANVVKGLLGTDSTGHEKLRAVESAS